MCLPPTKCLEKVVIELKYMSFKFRDFSLQFYLLANPINGEVFILSCGNFIMINISNKRGIFEEHATVSFILSNRKV